jgi:hypothetical protein
VYEEAVNPESAKDSGRYPIGRSFHRDEIADTGGQHFGKICLEF